MTALQLRKKALVLESELNRLAVQAECQRLREATGWLSLITGAQSLIRLAGVALTFHLRRPASADGFLSRALRLAPSLIQLWRAWTARSN
jgi:hypothetical protein